MTALHFFIDHCISNAIMDALRATGAEVLRLREHLPTDAPDEIVLAMAQQAVHGLCCSLSQIYGDTSAASQPVTFCGKK